MFFNQRFKEIKDRLDDLEKENKMIQRILRYSKENQITSYSTYKHIYSCLFQGMVMNYEYVTYIYMNGCEYKFENLYFNDPKIEPGERYGVVIVNDCDRKYVLDVNTCKYIVTK